MGLTLSLLTVVVIRLFELRMPKNPDGFHKWDIVRDLLAGQVINAAHFDHHAARWGVNLPIAVAQALFGNAANVMYVPVLLFCVLQGLATYLLGVALGSRAIGVCAVVLFSVVPQMCYVGSELLPTIFESTYVVAACYALVRALDASGRRWLYVSLALTCGAYLAKETTVFFLPGMMLGFYLTRRKLAECAQYALGFVAFVGLETLIYRLVYGFRLGRLSIISGHHLINARLQRPIGSFWDLFERYLELSTGFRELFYLALLVSVTYVAWRRWGPVSSAESLPTRQTNALRHGPLLIVMLGCWSYFFFSTFALKSLHPPQLAQPANQRYLFSAIPLLALLVSACGVQLARVALRRWTKPQRWSLAAGAGLALVGLSLLWRGQAWSKNPIVLTPRYEATLHDAFDRGIPIVARNDRANAATAVASVFLDRGRSKALHCEKFKAKNKVITRVCVNTRAEAYRGKSRKALRRQLTEWAHARYVDVDTTGGFSATTRGKSKKQHAPSEVGI